jgi:hypothetical protein
VFELWKKLTAVAVEGTWPVRIVRPVIDVFCDSFRAKSSALPGKSVRSFGIGITVGSANGHRYSSTAFNRVRSAPVPNGSGHQWANVGFAAELCR